MRILAEIDRNQNVPHEGRIIRRDAVRAIIPKGQNLFLIHSTVSGDYKFPGGGIEKDELHETALRREIAEESGAELINIVREFGKTIEYDYPIEDKYDAFCMSSYYYVCEISQNIGKQNLDDYEAALGFNPVWITVDQAIQVNKSLISTFNYRIQRWVRRETQVMELIKQELF